MSTAQTKTRPAAQAATTAQATDPQATTTAVEGTSPPPPAVNEQQALTTLAADDALAELGSAGNENVTREDMATPFLLLLQALSPEVDPASPKYLPGASVGMFCNTLTHQFYDGKQGLEVIDCYFEPLLTRWVPRDKGGGFKGVIEPTSMLLKQAKPSDKNELLLVLPDGTEVVNINQHYLLVRPFGSSQMWTPCVLGLTSTQIKKSRALNAELNMMRVNTAAGPKPIPRFATVWKLEAVPEKNAKGSFWGVKFTSQRRVNMGELQLAKTMYEALARGGGRAAPTEETHGGYDTSGQQANEDKAGGDRPSPLDDDIPF